ncbi:methylmalonyl-CoA mutase [Cellulophaga sp. HaHaR_3_176]|uniref:methylmalonyl-CoA mutase subunit beta n=1 Tax=Cellulophaga sp. HaHaR_3_176 TaxID=1942464 RepID=UPI001C20152C|nr:methylmalonyl-CoA mutase subunit beta [Cellulophaga sp. HaHaR_3_176]QWX85615.1 methylmalonyl-CoA mutase [Cellulophaga sp. HaHaR_3_176]
MKTNNSLFNDFSKVSTKQWKQKIQFDLKGKDYNEHLVWESLEGIKVKPFYNSEDIVTIQNLSSPSKTWHIAQTIYAGNAEIANKKAINALNKGAESIIFTIPSDTVHIEILLKNISLETTIVYFDFTFLSSAYITKFIALQKETTAGIFLNFDIINNLCKTGNWYTSLENDFAELLTLINKSKSITIDTTLYQNAGANTIQQLSYSLAHANEYLNRIPEAILPNITFTFKIAIGPNYFFEIAKIRALRILWKTVAQAYNANSTCHIIAIPSKRNKTLYDYNTNMLRSTTESMSAILGGANAVCNLPYDAIYHKSNNFGERIARNQLVILKEESYFDKTTNPADGSYYIENITKQISEKALDLFKNLEKAGGFLSQLKSGAIQKKIKESAQKEQDLFDTKKEILVGTNKYESSLDKMKGNLEIYPFAKNKPRKSILEPIIEKRLAEVIEQKRLEDE